MNLPLKMIGQELIIGFKQDKAFLTSNKALTFGQTNLPDVAKSFKTDAFWTIRILNFDASEKKAFVEILSYQNGVKDFSHIQLQLAEELNKIEKITFRSIDTRGLLRTLAGTTPVKIVLNKELPVFRHEPIYDQSYQTIKEPTKHDIEEKFFIPFKDVRFKLGGVSFDKKFKSFGKTFEITIPNLYIIEEFDAIKNYFANVLNTKKIRVIATLEIVDGKVTSIYAESPEIAKIDQELIENVKFDFVKQIIKKKISAENDKDLFTMNEYFDTFAELKANVFYKSDNELFEDLLTISDTKHYKHLGFLSSKHAHDILKLRFVHKPFSFVFLLQGDKNYHIIWETLDTEEATYIWHIDKDPAAVNIALGQVEAKIKTIKIYGKTAYIKEAEDSFRRIYHDYSQIGEGFVKWKDELENVMT